MENCLYIQFKKRIVDIENYSDFAVYNAGLYDNSKLNDFDEENWKKFAMSLWDIEAFYKRSKRY